MKFKIVIVILFSITIYDVQGQTIYGIEGLIKTPNAYIADTGKCITGFAWFKDYKYKNEPISEQLSASFNIGFHSRFDIGVCMTFYPHQSINDSASEYQIFSDRKINSKFILIKENKLFQLAIGMQDMVGTRIHNSTYIVASKRINNGKAISCTVNLGYGSTVMDLILGDAKNHNFIGLFGGAEIGVKKTVYVMVENDARYTNAEIKLRVKNWLKCNFSLMNMKYPSAGLSLKFTL